MVEASWALITLRMITCSLLFKGGMDLEKVSLIVGRYPSNGNDETFNMLMAITFIMDELQMDRMLFYRRSHAKQSILSPNRNIPALQLRVRYFRDEFLLSE